MRPGAGTFLLDCLGSWLLALGWPRDLALLRLFTGSAARSYLGLFLQGLHLAGQDTGSVRILPACTDLCRLFLVVFEVHPLEF